MQSLQLTKEDEFNFLLNFTYRATSEKHSSRQTVYAVIIYIAKELNILQNDVAKCVYDLQPGILPH
jgi:hypothetical protein